MQRSVDFVDYVLCHLCQMLCFQRGLTKGRSYTPSACCFYHPLGWSSGVEIKENRSLQTPAFISTCFQTFYCVTSCLIPPLSLTPKIDCICLNTSHRKPFFPYVMATKGLKKQLYCVCSRNNSSKIEWKDNFFNL